MTSCKIKNSYPCFSEISKQIINHNPTGSFTGNEVSYQTNHSIIFHVKALHSIRIYRHLVVFQARPRVLFDKTSNNIGSSRER